jgi:RNA polymerase sigma factor (sigma-70 family)
VIISDAASRITYRAPPLAMAVARAWLSVFAAHVTRLASEVRDSTLWAGDAGGQEAGAPRTKGGSADSARHVADREDVLADGQPVRSGDRLAKFQREIVPELDAAYNFARYLSRDADAAQDIVQDAFLRAYRSFDGFQGGAPRAWIFTIVRNCYHDWLIGRRRKARVEVDVRGSDDADEGAIGQVAASDDNPETALLRRAESRMVRLVLDKLPRSLREMLVLRELEGLSYRQIGEVAALPIGTVMSRLARARKQFESAWRQHAGSGNQP